MRQRCLRSRSCDQEEAVVVKIHLFKSLATLFIADRLNTTFSSRFREVFCFCLMLVKFVVSFLDFFNAKLMPVAASMSRSKPGSCQSWTAELLAFSRGSKTFFSDPSGLPMLSLAMTLPWKGHLIRSFLGHKRPLGNGARHDHLTSSKVSLITR